MKIIRELIPYLVIILVVALIRTFIITPVRVDGSSMDNTLKDGQILMLNKLDKNYERFDIVVIKVNNEKIVKRIIGLPSENIEYKDDVLYIDGKEVADMASEETSDFSLESLYGITKIPEDHYFVMGDNRDNSLDSRSKIVGLVSKDDILGTTSFRIFPFNKFGTFK